MLAHVFFSNYNNYNTEEDNMHVVVYYSVLLYVIKLIINKSLNIIILLMITLSNVQECIEKFRKFPKMSSSVLNFLCVMAGYLSFCY